MPLFIDTLAIAIFSFICNHTLWDRVIVSDLILIENCITFANKLRPMHTLLVNAYFIITS